MEVGESREGSRCRIEPWGPTMPLIFLQGSILNITFFRPLRSVSSGDNYSRRLNTIFYCLNNHVLRMNKEENLQKFAFLIILAVGQLLAHACKALLIEV